MSDNVEHPSHYNAGSVETIDGIRAALGDAFLDYCRGNVLKYVWRCRHKGKLLEDLRKAAKYLEWAIEEAESEKTSEPQELAIPDGWRELEENEPLSEDDLFELDGEWAGHECDPSGGVYSSRIHCRHIRKIETDKPEHVDGVWVEEAEEKTAFTLDELEELTDRQIAEQERIKKEKEEADANASRKIETESTSEMPDSSIPHPGPKIEPTEWIPKVGDKVRVAGGFMNPVGEVGFVKEFCAAVKGNFTISTNGGTCTLGWFRKDDVELIEAAQ